MIFALFFSTSVFSQNNSDCPTVKFILPDKITMAGEAMLFEISTNEEAKKNELGYKWTVSNSEIITGQGTSVIKVATTSKMAGNNITATVQISGFPVGCENKYSETGGIASIPNIDNCETHSKKSVQVENAIVENAMIVLENSPDSLAVFYLYFEENATSRQINKRIQRIVNYSVSRGFTIKDRVIFATKKGGNGHFKICFWIKNNDNIDCDDCQIIRNLDFYLKRVPRNKKNLKRDK